MSSVSVRRKGFTLTELLAALAIISLLVAIVLPRIANRVTKARAARAAADIQAVELALENYVADWGRYPPIMDYGKNMKPDDEGYWDEEEKDGLWDNNRDADDNNVGDPFIDERGGPIANNTLTYMQYISIVLKKRAGGHGPYLAKGVPKDPWGNDYVYAYIPNPTLVRIQDLNGDGVCDEGDYCQWFPMLKFNPSGRVMAAAGMYYYDQKTGDRIPVCDPDEDGVPDDCDGFAGPDGMAFEVGPPYQKVFIYSRGRDGMDDFGFRGWFDEPDGKEHEYETEDELQADPPYQSTDAITNWGINEDCGPDPYRPGETRCLGWENHPFYN